MAPGRVPSAEDPAASARHGAATPRDAAFVDCAGVGYVRADLADVPAALWWSAGAPLPGARGRGAVAVLTLPRGLRAVVRTYRRGGVFGAVLRERFFAGARARREVDVLRALHRARVPVVEPLAALARRAGVCWQLRLATALVAGAEPLPAFVARHPALRRAAVRAAGDAVARAFAASLHHRDLHPDNLIAVSSSQGSPRVFLLDLDRARLGPAVDARARDGMLARMARYLIRHRARLPAAPARTDALRFLAGMGYARAERRSIAHTVTALLRRRLRWRRWFAG